MPVVMRATTLDYIPKTTRALAAYAAASQGPVFVVGCWRREHFELDGGPVGARRAIAIGFGASHPACNVTWRRMALFNPRARSRLAPLQPIWGAVEILTASALAHPLVLPRCPRREDGGGRRGPDCMAFVIDPDVLLPTAGTVRAACEYYDAPRYDAVLLFAPPTARFATLTDAILSGGGGADPEATRHMIPRLLGNRHISFLSSHALNVLASHIPHGTDIDSPTVRNLQTIF